MATEKAATKTSDPSTTKDPLDFGLGSPVEYWLVRSGGQPEKRDGVVTAIHKPVAGVDVLQSINLEWSFKIGANTATREAFYIRRGRGKQDAPCWCPITEGARS